MMTFLTTYGIELLFGLISAGALAFCRYLWKQNKEFKNYKQEDENKKYRQMILDEIGPLTEELDKIQEKLEKTKIEAEITHQKMYDDLEKIQAHNDENFRLILNSYKFRFIQLCKTHLKDEYITGAEFEQLAEMFKLYSSLGGNGLAKDYYEKVLKLPLHD